MYQRLRHAVRSQRLLCYVLEDFHILIAITRMLPRHLVLTTPLPRPTVRTLAPRHTTAEGYHCSHNHT